MEKLHISRVIVLEGKYDKIKLSSITDAMIVTTEGFGIFKDREKKEMLKALAEKNGLLVLSDSDSAGKLIRNHLRSFIPKEQIINVYAPCLKGKEARKSAPGKEGLLGVEGTPAEILRNLLLPYENEEQSIAVEMMLTKAILIKDGFSGGKDSSFRRKALLKAMNLPENLSSTLLVEAVNVLGGLPFYENAKEKLNF